MPFVASFARQSAEIGDFAAASRASARIRNAALVFGEPANNTLPNGDEPVASTPPQAHGSVLPV